MRLRLLELGFIQGENIEIVSHKLGLWIVNILSSNGNPVSTMVLRDDEFERLCLI